MQPCDRFPGRDPAGPSFDSRERAVREIAARTSHASAPPFGVRRDRAAGAPVPAPRPNVERQLEMSPTRAFDRATDVRWACMSARPSQVRASCRSSSSASGRASLRARTRRRHSRTEMHGRPNHAGERSRLQERDRSYLTATSPRPTNSSWMGDRPDAFRDQGRPNPFEQLRSRICVGRGPIERRDSLPPARRRTSSPTSRSDAPSHIAPRKPTNISRSSCADRWTRRRPPRPKA